MRGKNQKKNQITFPDHQDANGKCASAIAKNAQQLQILELYFGDGLGFFFLDEIFTN
jgi:hypothetical protein